MARPPKGKPLTLRPIRLDDDVWAECQRLRSAHGTINEGLRERLFSSPEVEYSPPIPEVPKVARLKMPKPQAQSWKRGPRPKGDRKR